MHRLLSLTRLPLVLLVFLGAWQLPFEADNTRKMAAVFLAVVTAWITEALPVPVTALLVGPLLVFTGLASPAEAFSPYADPVLFIFIGGFLLAQSMTLHGLDRRAAGWLLRSPYLARSPLLMRAAVALTAMALSMWISNTASAAVLTPIVISAIDHQGTSSQRGDTGTLLLMAYACSVGGMATLVGTPPNVITVRFLNSAGIRFGFVQWLSVGLPIALSLIAVLVLFFHWRAPPPKPTQAVQGKERTKPLSRAEKYILFAFASAILGWIAPAVLRAAGYPAQATLLHPGAVAIAAASLLAFFRTEDRQPVLPWSEATRIDWGTILLFGGGITLGLHAFKHGLVEWLSQHILQATGVDDLWSLTLLAAAFTTVITELCSNVAASSMLVPLVIGTAQTLGVSPIPPALAVGFAASCAFMMPISTAPNAIVYATGRAPIRSMLLSGLPLNVICTGIVVLWLRLFFGP